MANYWEDPKLKLYYKSSTDYSLDDNGAKRYKKPATVTGTLVTDVQTDLIAAGYLTGTADGAYGNKTHRAVLRFQRRAQTKLRMSTAGVPADVATITYCNGSHGVCDPDTAKELRLWITSKLKAPLGRYKMIAVSGGKLRSDAANAWTTASLAIKAKGGTIDHPYGDTTRSVTFRKKTGGNSLYSLHYTGRAVDLNQGLAGGKKQRYFVEKETVNGDTYWRILCKTTDQTGAQGKKILKTAKRKYYVFYSKKEKPLPEAYYLDITEQLRLANFIRIKAHSNWKTNAKGQEWWHFHYNVDIQATFQDEMELIGHDEATLRKNGWNTDARLDRKPG